MEDKLREMLTIYTGHQVFIKFSDWGSYTDIFKRIETNMKIKKNNFSKMNLKM